MQKIGIKAKDTYKKGDIIEYEANKRKLTFRDYLFILQNLSIDEYFTSYT